MNIIDDIKNSFRNGNTLMRFIYINIAVFVFMRLLYVLFFLWYGNGIYAGDLFGYFQDTILFKLSVPSKVPQLLIQPWSVITYMFLHFDFLHILFNLLWLYWFGKIFLMYLSERQLLFVYIFGGIAGAALFMLSYNVFPAFMQIPISYALGASASVMAITVAITAYSPNMELQLVFLGPVKLKYIALVYLVTDIIQIAGSNAGGHIAHLGGALFGFLFIMQLKRGKDTSSGFMNIMEKLQSMMKRQKKMKVEYGSKTKHETDMEYNARKKHEQEEIDIILEKISKSGYDGLTKEEKEKLFRMSGK